MDLNENNCLHTLQTLYGNASGTEILKWYFGGAEVNKNEAIAAAQSALRLRHNVTHNNRGVWTWQGYGWRVYMWESGTVVEVIDDWQKFRTAS